MNHLAAFVLRLASADAMRTARLLGYGPASAVAYLDLAFVLEDAADAYEAA